MKLVSANLPQLQNLIKRDPQAYKEEFLQQWTHYEAIRNIFLLNPDHEADRFRELVAFISQTASCYPKDTADFPSQLSSLLLEHYASLSQDTRRCLVQNLVLLRNKGTITSIDLLKSLFPVLPRTSSSALRASIRKTILTDIRTANTRTTNHKLNRSVQAMLFTMVERGMNGEVLGDKGKLRAVPNPNQPAPETADEALWAIIMTKELWRKRVWSDAKSVAIVALGCFHPALKVQSAALHFFLDNEDEPEDSDNEDNNVDVKALHHQRDINKKSRGTDAKIQRKLKSAKKKLSKPEAVANFPALQLLHDPQTFSEKLYDLMNRYDKRFSLDHKILITQVLTRVVGHHKLCVLGFYTYVMKYLTHRQLRVPTILTCLAQSVHELTPPDALMPVVRKIANEFIHPGVASEVIAAGLNSIRELCRRQPWAMEEDLLGDLVDYRKSRDKTVTAAARGLLQLYREVNPNMLKRSERGKHASMNMATGKQPLPFGHTPEAVTDIEGLTLLEDHLKELEEQGHVQEDDDEAAWAKWEVETDSSESSDSEGWIDVDDESGDIVISDSEDEEEEKGIEPTDTTNPPRISTIATTKILTPADFSLINNLRIQAAEKVVEGGGGSRAKRKLAELEAERKAANRGQQGEVFLSEQDILGPRKKQKADYEARMASVREGREGREKYGSRKGKKSKDVHSSSTNREKARNKPIMMIMGSSALKSKKKASLREKQQRLRNHISKAKKSKK